MMSPKRPSSTNWPTSRRTNLASLACSRSATPKAKFRPTSVRRARNCTPHGRMAVPSRELARTPSARVAPVASTRCATARMRRDASHKPRRWPRRCVSYCLGHRHIRGSHSGCHSPKSMSSMASVAGMRTSGPQIQLKTGLFTKGPRSPSP